MSVTFRALFLTAAAVAAYVLPDPACSPGLTSSAAPGHRRRVVRHLMQGLIIGLSGVVVGVLLQSLATGAVTQAYTTSLGIPTTIVASTRRFVDRAGVRVPSWACSGAWLPP